MRKIFFAIFAALAFASCTKTVFVEETVDVEKEVVIEHEIPAAASYSYDGVEAGVYTLIYTEFDDYIEFFVAREPEPPYSCYFDLMFAKDRMGAEVSTDRLVKGVDYLFTFEDKEHFYSSSYYLKGGSIRVRKRVQANDYSLDINVLLQDGKPFSFSYAGVFEKTAL